MRKIISIITFFLINVNIQGNMKEYTIIEDLAKTPILTPTLKKRQTLKLQLKNGLKAYLISDPDLDKSGASMSVSVGSWSEPEEYPGMAHFLEHMLFLGSKKYPKESDFSNFMTTHGGSTNAFTAEDQTAYMFSINHDAFEESLRRFSDFFIAPLFNLSGVAREMKAVDQEFHKNIENDHWRQWQIIKEICNQDHPHSKFSTGNSQTLSNIPIEKLKEWYQKNYSAGLMHLTICSKMPMEKLRHLVVANFKDIQNRGTKPLDVSKEIMQAENRGKFLYIEPIKKARKLTLLWEMPGKFAQKRAMENKPSSLIGHVLGDEGGNSLLAKLKEEELAEGLGAGGYELGPSNFIFAIEVKLTKNGLKEREKVIEHCFRAINNLKEKYQKKYVFDEIKTIAQNNYQYQSREDVFWTVMQHAQKIVKEDLSTYPEKTNIPQKFDKELIKEFVYHLRPQNCLFIVTANPKKIGIPFTKKEKWIGGLYEMRGIGSKKLTSWENLKSIVSIDLPPPNKFIPEKLTLLTKEAETSKAIPKPQIIEDSEFGKIYYAKDKRYLVPESSWDFHIKTAALDGSAEKSVLMELYIKSLLEELKPFSYPASIANLNYYVKATDFGFVIRLDGFSEKTAELFKEILSALKEVKPSIKQFKIYKDSLLQNYKNIYKEPPFRQALQWTFKLVSKDFILDEEKINTIKKVNHKDLLDFSKDIYKQVYTEGTFYGNLKKSEAEHAWEMLKKSLRAKPYPKTMQRKKEILHLPESENFPSYVEIETERQGNAIVLVIEGEEFSLKNRAVQNVLAKAMKEPFWSELRTKQQTGYLTDCWAQEIERQLFNFFVVQSNSHTNRDLLARFELFLENLLQEAGKGDSPLTKESFETVKQAIITELKEPPQNLQEMSGLLTTLAFDYDGDFDWKAKRIKALEKLTYEEFLPLAKKFLEKANKKRVAIMLNGTIPREDSLEYSPTKSIEEIREQSEYSPRQKH